MDHHHHHHHHVTTGQVKTPSSSSTSNGNNDSKNKKKMYKGVRLRKWGKWVSEIRLPNSRERIWLGSYDSAEKAAKAFDAALYCLRGRHANFNFPDTPFNLDINAVSNNSLTPQQIREVAANFANKNPPIIDNNNNNNGNVQSKNVTETSGSSSSTTMHDNGSTIDWTFLNMLDGSTSSTHDSNFVGSDYGLLYSDLEKMHSGELMYSIPPPPLFEDYQNVLVEGNYDDDYNEDPFSHQSFLWSWNF